MNYPENTSHIKKWFFKSRQEIDDICLKKYNDFKEKFKTYNVNIPKYADIEKTKLYFCYQLTHFCDIKRLQPQIVECAIVLYNRFYLKEIILEYDPRILIFTCIILAIKLEGYGRLYKINEFFSDIDINLDKVLEHENVVCSSLDFELNFLYTKECIFYLKNQFLNYINKYINKDNEVKNSFENICDKIYVNTSLECLKLLENFFITFTYTPAQIALYCFINNIKINFNIVNADKFILEFITNNNQILFQKLKNKIDELHIKYKDHFDLRNTFDDENTTKQIGETLDMCIDIYDILKKKKSHKKSKKNKLNNEDNEQNESKKMASIK
ncbi:cyclin, putative [Plasmodium chabaudi chabaudi]|uniref:Cyclin 1, putative n=1 Tax=Plasmodium chabaudi chabaudi TaxID=31271 RepID=A0A077TTQ8_PLACU|nr:cyclin 1, putative [Plasmodium chabaudi chabaudi]SCM04855.1 cyclin, putative [Plasmodium chabaudi chabaudi]SCM08177.1 cyclin, putative [Plasmodium chabaudi chabaudi]VTZ70269.1 cyclin 1, putative [Plasmodium chabaudi chabaudi]|eukprot:XP_738846.1 cyclin, putative [Plasmodium chabaudi chabaudi]